MQLLLHVSPARSAPDISSIHGDPGTRRSRWVILAVRTSFRIGGWLYPPTVASLASAWASQNAMPMERNSSMAADSSDRA